MQSSAQPLVVCVCLTRNRPQWLRQAVGSFYGQSYPRKRMLIWNTGAAPLGEDTYALEERFFPGAFGTIGKLRNLANWESWGELICHWDDDDYSAPNRIAHQVARLEGTGKAVTGFGSMRFTDGERWWNVTLPAGHVFGSSLCYRRDYWERHPFADLQIGEDRKFYERAMIEGQLDICDAGDLMHGTIHPGNTSPREIGDGWRRCPAPEYMMALEAVR